MMRSARQARDGARWRSALAATAVLSLLLAACGGQDDATDGDADGDGDAPVAEPDDDADDAGDAGEGDADDDGDAEAAEDVELTMAWWGGEARHALKNDMLDQYEEQNPHVTVSREFAEFSAYWERMSTQLAGGNMPDLLHMTERTVGDYEGALLDLTPYVEDGSLDLSGYPDAFVEGGTVNGELVMVIVGGTIPVAQYNTAMLDELGVDHPPMEWSWEEFEQIVTTIADETADDVWAITDGGASAVLFDTFLMQQGLSLFAPDEAALGFEEEHFADWLGRWDDLRQAGAIPPGQVMAEQSGVPFEDSLFARGQVAMFLANHNQLPIFQEHVDGEIQIAMLPTVSDGDPVVLVLGTNMSVAATSDHADEAVALMDWWLNDEAAISQFNAEYGAPANEAAFDVLESEGALSRVLDFSAEVEDIAVLAPPRPEGGTAVEDIIGRANEAVSLGTSVEQAAQQFYAEMQTAMN